MDTCKACDFRTNFVVSSVSGVKSKDLSELLINSRKEILNLSKDVKISGDTAVNGDNIVITGVYKFNKSPINFIGFLKIKVDKENGGLSSMNCLTTDSAYQTYKLDIKQAFESF